MDHRPIGMFDSGVGGMTVFKEIVSALPNEDIIYIGDTASFPYGGKSKETIIELTKKQIKNLIEKGAKIVVIACGTATSQALDEVQKLFSIPILGIIEPTVQYLKGKHAEKIGIIATTGTIRSRGWEKEIKRQIADCQIQSKACPLLASMAEEGWIDNEIAKLTIHEYIKDFTNIDTLILGCTHYPLFKKLIENELDRKVEIINTGEMVSQSLKEYLTKNGLKNIENHIPNYEVYLTDMECNFLQVARNLIKSEKIMDDIKMI